jgi:hypothetical protein
MSGPPCRGHPGAFEDHSIPEGETRVFALVSTGKNILDDPDIFPDNYITFPRHAGTMAGKAGISPGIPRRHGQDWEVTIIPEKVIV